MNLHTLLTKHQIVHGLEIDQSYIDAFVRELTELQLDALPKEKEKALEAFNAMIKPLGDVYFAVVDFKDAKKRKRLGEAFNVFSYAAYDIYLAKIDEINRRPTAIKLMGGRDE